MNFARPVVAMLWENWQLTRVEAGQRLGLGLVLGAGAMILFGGKGPIIAFVILMLIHSYIWLSIAKLNGGRLADGYKPGFPFHLLFVRPVPTGVMVGVAMAYDVVSCVALYVVSAVLLGWVFGKPLPISSVILFLVAYHLAYACGQWSSRSRVTQWIALLAFSIPMYLMLQHRFEMPLKVEFTLIENAAMVLLGVVSIFLTVAGVSRQRRGDAVAVVSKQKEWSGGFPDWLVTVFRFRCPTSSATRAQVWFELRSSGLPVLVIGVGVGALVFLLCAISGLSGTLGNAAIGVVIFSVPVVLFGLGSNAFGIRRKQGRTYASAFELTQPYGTARLATLKVLVRAACVLVALLTIGASLWASGGVLGAWWQVSMDNNQDALPVLLKLLQKFAANFGNLTGYAQAGLAFVASILVTSVVVWQAAREALRARFPKFLLAVQWLPTLWGLASIALALAHRNGLVSAALAKGFFTASFWVSGSAILICASYLLWRGFAQRVLTIVYVCGVLAISAAFAVAWIAGMPGTGAVATLWPVLLVLMLGVLAPWSLGRARHA
jgi:hypothetical protein